MLEGLHVWQNSQVSSVKCQVVGHKLWSELRVTSEVTVSPPTLEVSNLIKEVLIGTY